MRPATLGRRKFLVGALGTGAGAALATFPGSGIAHAALTTVTVTGRPAAESERLRLQQAQRASQFTPSGVYVPANTALTVTVTGNALPTLRVGIFDYYAAVKTPRSYALTSGTNTITDPHGGPVFLELIGTGKRATVTFDSGGVLMPTFDLGRTTEAGFAAQLDAYTAAAYVNLVSPHAILTVSRASALAYRSEDHTALLRAYETILGAHATYSGLDGATSRDRRNANPFHLIEVTTVPSGVGAYATHGYTGDPAGCTNRLLTVNGATINGWGAWHELGHQHQQWAYKPGALTEVTVNLYSLNAQRTLGNPSRLLTKDANGLDVYDQAFAKRGTTAYTALSVWEKLVPLWQLDLAFGRSVWPKVHRLVRADRPAAPTDQERYDALAVYASRASTYDLTDFFVNKWLFPISTAGQAATAALALPRPPVDASSYRE